jgi:hypothetical protein
MQPRLDPFSFLVVSLSGWMNQHQQHVIDYLMEENRVLREQIGNRRMRFSDEQRRRLAAKAKKIGRKLLNKIATIVTPETLLAWHLAAQPTSLLFRISQAALSALQLSNIVGTELLTPETNGFMGDDDSALGEKIRRRSNVRLEHDGSRCHRTPECQDDCGGENEQA